MLGKTIFSHEIFGVVVCCRESMFIEDVVNLKPFADLSVTKKKYCGIIFRKVVYQYHIYCKYLIIIYNNYRLYDDVVNDLIIKMNMCSQQTI